MAELPPEFARRFASGRTLLIGSPGEGRARVMSRATLTAAVRHVRALAVGGATAPTDGALLRAFAAAGDGEAFAALVKRHGPLVLGVCRRVLHRLHDAEDAFQATFVLLAQRAVALGGSASLAGWL